MEKSRTLLSKLPPLINSFPWDLPIQYVKKVGPARAFLFGKLDVKTVEDLLYFVPFRYEDRTEIKKIGSLIPGKEQTTLGEIDTLDLIKTSRRHMQIVTMIVRDSTGLLQAKWFNQPYLKPLFKKGEKIMLSGAVRINTYGGPRLAMESPQYEKVDPDEPHLHMGRIVPIYHETKGLTSRQIRSVVYTLLQQYGETIPDILPESLIQKYNLIPLRTALSDLHFPPSQRAAGPQRPFGAVIPQTSLLLPRPAGAVASEWPSPPPTRGARPPDTLCPVKPYESLPQPTLVTPSMDLMRQRLAFDELFLLELGLAYRKKQAIIQEKGISFKTASKRVEQLLGALSFQLTSAQERVLAEIKNDMASIYPMHRLLQGDVGSGKTLVALIVLLIAIENGYQAALMVPTEILAEQHFARIAAYCKSLSGALSISSLLLTSDMKKREKEEAQELIASGKVDLVIGTHALIQENVRFKKLGVVVVDEQHKFGVLQRAKLSQKGNRPDMLIMTATPIPRTLALTLYGDLNLSVIDALPPGRAPIQTRVFFGKQRVQAYQLLEQELCKGRQGYVVVPLVEASEALDLKAAKEFSETLKRDLFPHRHVGLLHGRLKKAEKEQTMRDFAEGRIEIIVATTVIEVGIDLPNATVMVIEHAERLGLTQLHQLRGRVGRGAEQSYCFLISGYALTEEARTRLRVMQESTDGFKIAEADLTLRGPGEFLGTRQSGIPELKNANLQQDGFLLETARQEAFCWIEQDPDLNRPESAPLRAAMERKWKGKIEWLTAG